MQPTHYHGRVTVLVAVVTTDIIERIQIVREVAFMPEMKPQDIQNNDEG